MAGKASLQQLTKLTQKTGLKFCNESTSIGSDGYHHSEPRAQSARMGRNYKRKPGTRSYRDYTEESMTAAIQAHKKGLSLRQAAAKYNVTKDSLSRRLKSDKIPKLGKLAQCKKLH